MAKKDQVSFADLVAGLEKNNLKLNESIQAQLDAQLNTEKVLTDSKDIQAKQAETSLKSSKQDDKLVKDIHKGLVAKSGDGLNSNIIKLLKVAKETQKVQLDSAKGILAKTGERREFRTIGQRIGGVKENVKDFFSMRGFLDKTGIVKRGSGGIFSEPLDAREDRQKYAKARIAAGDPTVNLFGEKRAQKIFEKQRGEQQELTRKQNKLEKKKEDLGKLNIKSELIESSTAKETIDLANKFAKVDPSVRLEKQPSGEDDSKSKSDTVGRKDIQPVSKMVDGRITAGPKAPAVDSEEVANEQAQVQSQQFDILQKIEENTRPSQEGGKGAESGGGSGIMAGIGKGMQALGKGIGGVGKGIGTALRSILVGLAEGLTALGIAFANPLVTVALAGLTIAAMGIGKALEYAAPAIAAFAPVLMKIAEVIGGVFMAAIKEVPNVLRAVGEIITAIGDSIVNIITAVTDSIERLSKIDGTNLIAVGAGLLAVAGGLVAFSGAQAIAGVGNLVGGFLSGITGQKTPVEQLEEIAKFGPNLNQAGTGVKNLAKGLLDFSQVDSEKIAAIAKLPVEKIAAMGAAMNNANTVYEKSGKNKEAEGAAQSKSTGGTSVVSAPTVVNNNTQQQGFFKNPVRNQDGSIQNWMKTRYANF